MPEITYREAIRQALRGEMTRDDRVYIMGEDIGSYGGSYAVNPSGTLACAMPSWTEAVQITRWRHEGNRYSCEGAAAWTEEPRSG